MTLLFRALFGSLLLSTALGKLLDNRGFAAILVDYQLPLPQGLLLHVGLLISLVELALGLAIALGVRLPTAARSAVGLHLGYLALAVATNLRGIPVANCGCFGVFLARPMTWFTVVEDLVLVLLASAFFWSVSGVERGDPGRAAAPARAA